MGLHFATAHRATVNDNPIRCRFTLHAKGQQTIGHDLDAVGLLDPQFFGATQHGAPFGAGRRHEQHRELVDRQRHRGLGNLDAF